MPLTEATLIATEVLQESAKEVAEIAIKEVEENIARSTFVDVFESKEFTSKLGEGIKENKYLSRNFENLPENPTEAMIRLQETKSPKLKGDIGEIILESTDEMFGNVENQIETINNRVDMLTEFNKNTKFQELVVEESQIGIQDLYVKAGESVATEVKNGELDYLISELNSNHLIEQVKAGLDIAEKSYVAINEDCARQMIENPLIAEEVIKEVNEAGGKILLRLPEYKKQLGKMISVMGG